MVTTTWSKQAPPTTSWLKEGITQQGVSVPLCAGVESDPDILVPNNPLTWTERFATAGTNNLLFHPMIFTAINKIVVPKRQQGTDRLEVVHSVDGVTWTTVQVSTDPHQFSTDRLPHAALRTSSVLSLLANGNNMAVYETTDLVTFVKRYNQTITTGLHSVGAIISKAGTLYLFTGPSADQVDVYKDNGANFVAIAAIPAPYETLRGIVIGFGGLIYALVHDAAATVTRLFKLDAADAWQTVFTWPGGKDGTSLEYFADSSSGRTEMWIVFSNGEIWMYDGVNAPVQRLTIIPTGSNAGSLAKQLGRNLYLGAPAPGTEKLYRSPDGYAVVDLGVLPVISTLNRLTYFETTRRFYLTDYDLTTHRIRESSAPS